MSTPYSLAMSFVELDGAIHNPKIITCDTCASTLSLSVIVSIPLLITFTLTPSKSTFYKALRTAYSDPLISVFNTTLISFVSESIDSNKFSNDNDVLWNLFFLAKIECLLVMSLA